MNFYNGQLDNYFYNLFNQIVWKEINNQSVYIFSISAINADTERSADVYIKEINREQYSLPYTVIIQNNELILDINLNRYKVIDLITDFQKSIFKLNLKLYEDGSYPAPNSLQFVGTLRY